MIGTASLPVRTSDLGIYFREVNQTPLVAAQEEHELGYRIQEGDPAARDQLVRANLRLVVHIAKAYLGRGLSLDDLIQEGSLGLVHAAEAFDPERNTRFSTYAKYWICHAIQRALDNSGATVRVPSYAVDLVSKWRKTATMLSEKWGRQPTREEVARELHLTAKQIKILDRALAIFNGAKNHTNFDEVFGIDGDARTASVAAARPECEDDLRQVLELVAKLPERDATVLRLRFGLDGNAPMTLCAVGRKIGLTRERVRQIEQAALARLRERVCE